MVYESDFYTTRRPYSSSSRPTISSYSVTTPLRVIPGVQRVYSYSSYSPITYTTSIPYYSYYRTLPSTLLLPSAVPFRYYSRSTPVRVITSPLRDYSPPRILSVSVRPSVIRRELMRIEHKSRPRYGYDATEEFLNSVHAKEFEDDLRSIRTETSRVLNRVHTPLPRGRRAVSCAPFSRYDSSITTDRDFLDHVRGVSRTVKDDIFTLSNYAEPVRRHVGLDRFRPSRKFSAQRPLEDPNAELKEKKAARANKMTSVNEVDEIELEKIRAKRQAEQKEQEAKLAKEEKEKQEAEARRIETARRKAQEEEALRKAEEEAEAQRIEKARKEAAEAQQKAAEEAETKRLAEEAEAKRLAEEAEAKRLAEEAEAKRLAEEAEAKRLAEEAEAKRLAEEAEAKRLAEEEEAKRQAEEAEAKRQADELARQQAAEEAARLEEEAERLREFENVAKAEREAELARQAAELVEIAKLEAEALRLLEYEQAASELEQPLDSQNSQSTNADFEALASEELAEEPVIEEPLTPAAVEDTKEDISEVQAEEAVAEPTGANAEPVTDDEVEPLE